MPAYQPTACSKASQGGSISATWPLRRFTRKGGRAPSNNVGSGALVEIFSKFMKNASFFPKEAKKEDILKNAAFWIEMYKLTKSLAFKKKVVKTVLEEIAEDPE